MTHIEEIKKHVSERENYHYVLIQGNWMQFEKEINRLSNFEPCSNLLVHGKEYFGNDTLSTFAILMKRKEQDDQEK